MWTATEIHEGARFCQKAMFGWVGLMTCLENPNGSYSYSPKKWGCLKKLNAKRLPVFNSSECLRQQTSNSKMSILADSARELLEISEHRGLRARPDDSAIEEHFIGNSRYPDFIGDGRPLGWYSPSLNGSYKDFNNILVVEKVRD